MTYMNRRGIFTLFATIALLALCAGCSSASPQRNADGGFEGVVTNVREDSLQLQLENGASMRVDTWAVCGDNTARVISRDDQITVFAEPDGMSYEAQSILDANGQTICGTPPAGAETEQSADMARPNADISYEGSVVDVWEDGLELQLADGSSVRVDTWDVCGDNTARNISTGDQITVYADREGLGYDALRILDANGEAACPGPDAQLGFVDL